MEKFNEENLMSSIATLLIPIKLSGTSGVVIGELVKRLTIPEQEADDVKGKIGRYFDMFAEVMMKTA